MKETIMRKKIGSERSIRRGPVQRIKNAKTAVVLISRIPKLRNIISRRRRSRRKGSDRKKKRRQKEKKKNTTKKGV